MGRVIPFYVPEGFNPRVKVKWVEQREPLKVIEFRPSKVKKPA